jgi:ferrous iron transport protein B
LKLNHLKPGNHGVIISVGGSGVLRRRLLDMGLTPNTKVYVRKVAPMGDPIEINLRGYELTIRAQDASVIEIQTNDQDMEGGNNDFCSDRKSKFRKNNTVQPAHGSNQHVGNFPGVTVEKKEGTIKKHPELQVVDLPGIYSLSPYSDEEIVTRDFLLKEKPDGSSISSMQRTSNEIFI